MEFRDDRDGDIWEIAKQFPRQVGGQKVLDFVEAWARLMQAEMARGKSIAEIAQDTRDEAGYRHLSKHQYVRALRLITEVWQHGHQLHPWLARQALTS